VGNDDGQVTILLEAAAAGDPLATERLFPLVYGELRRIAGALMNNERGSHTLQPTALVNEAYLRLVGSANQSWDARAHFFGAAARAMRQILIDHARRVKVRQNAAEALAAVPTLDSNGPQDRAADDLLSLDTAMDELLTRDRRQHDVVMLRFFAGLSVEQTAQALGLSASTVKNEWMYARACLMHRVEEARQASRA
jgi:RNA polymerase sigma factor (TIGR02999 family)